MAKKSNHSNVRIVRMQLGMMQEKYFFIIVRSQKICSRLIRIKNHRKMKIKILVLSR